MLLPYPRMIAEIFTALMEPLGKAIGSIPKSIRALIGKVFAALANALRKMLVGMLRLLLAPFCRPREAERRTREAGRSTTSGSSR